jgi:LPXTG-motif cell wall-anchored protein
MLPNVTVVRELPDTGQDRPHRALRLIGAVFLVLAAYLIVRTIVVFAIGDHRQGSPLGITWTAMDTQP